MDKDFYDKLLFAFTDVLNYFANISHVVYVLEFRRSW